MKLVPGILDTGMRGRRRTEKAPRPKEDLLRVFRTREAAAKQMVVQPQPSYREDCARYILRYYRRRHGSAGKEPDFFVLLVCRPPAC